MSWIQESVKRGKAVNNFYSFDGTDVYSNDDQDIFGTMLTITFKF